MGRPPKYSAEVKEEALRRLAAGESLRSVAGAMNLPLGTVNGWSQAKKWGLA